MRSNATLEEYQKTSPHKPNVDVHYYTVSWQDVSDDVLVVKTSMLPYGSKALVVLTNEDEAYDAVDFKDKQLKIAYGYDDQTSELPYFWIYDFKIRSTPTRMGTCVMLYCEGAWNRLRRWTADAEYYYNQPDQSGNHANFSIKEIIDDVCVMAGIDLGTSIDDDSVVAVWEPVATIHKGENGATVVRSLLRFTKCRLVPRTDKLHLKFPEAGDAVDYHYHTVS